jgi:hypothetical protein
MKQRHYAYLAGLIDGDGCIAAGRTFRERSNCYEYTLKIEVTSSVRKTVSRLIELFGGIPCKQWIDNTLYWKWVCQVRKDQRVVLEGIIPFLLVKKQQARLALKFVDLGHAENPAERRSLVAAIQNLNQSPITEEPNSKGKLAFAYVAGLMDAEGTLSITKSSASTAQIITIANDNPNLLGCIERMVGGTKLLSTPPNHYAWNFFGTWKDKEKFLLAILPYLVTKREQGILLLEYVRLAKRKMPEYRKILMQKIQALNHPVLECRTSETQVPNTSSEVKTEPELMGNHESVLVRTQAT